MVNRYFSGWTALFGVAVMCLLFGQVLNSAAQAQTPSSDQIEMFRNLPPDQQQAILETLNRGGSTSRARDDRRVDPELEFPRTIRPREQDGEEEDLDRNGMPREPRFKSDDTILLSLEIRQFERRAPEIEEQERRQREQQQQQSPLQQNIPPIQVPSRVRGDAQQGERQLDEPELLERTEEEERRLGELRERVLRRNPYKLDKWGILNVPELGPIPLAGLTVEEATERLSAEVSLQDFIVRVTRLPLKPTGTQALKPFGYDLFSGMPSTFAPATDVPVPAEYVVGPGDTIEVQLIGNTKGRYALVVGRDGRINFPELGPITVSGQRFEQVRDELESRVREQMIGTTASVGIGELRSIRVFVLGDAETPGSYTVSGLSTITNALFVSGGVKTIGSLRDIQLKRAGRTVLTLDLYDLLLRGDTSADARLLPGDVIFIPPVGPTVSLAGEIRRPAIYELRGETTASELIALGGGFTAQADPSLGTLERVSDTRQRVTIDVNLAADAGSRARVQAGDVLRVPSIRPVLENSVSLNGHVHRPGEFQYRPGMRLADVITSIDELQPNADLRYVLVRRELPPDRRVTVFSANLERAIAEPSSAANFELAPRDKIHVFDLESGRDRIIEPLMRELHLHSRIGEPTREVSVSGRVKVAGKYPLEPGMRLSDAIRAGGGLSEAAYGGEAELTRYSVGEDGTRRAELIEIDLLAILDGDPAADVPLQAFDHVVIKEVPLWASQEEVDIQGEVRYPGRYPIHRGETLSSVLQRAGGLTTFAFAEGSVFTRRELRERERKQLETLANRMQSDLAQLSLQAAVETGRDAGQALAVGQSLLASLRSTQAVGRLVINLDRSMRAPAGSEHDVVLKDGDRLIVPRVTQEVTVIGEVQSTTSHLYNATFSRDDYISMSGGLTRRGDEDHIYVVRANGSVEARGSSRWFSSGVQIQPGDTIVAPLDTERMRPLPFWQAVTSIIYNLAISAAAVDSFRD
jgi:polysaccharide export outer membrane protein